MALLKRIEQRLAAVRQRQGFSQGAELGITGSAAIGADMLFAAEESIHNTEWTTDRAGRADPAGGLSRAGPGARAAGGDPGLAGFSRPALIALLARLSGRTRVVRLQGLPDHEDFHHRGPVRGGHRLLSVPHRPLPRGIAAGADAAGAVRRALAQVGHAVTASAMTTILGLGTMIFADFGKYPLRRADHRLVAGRGPGGLPDAGPGPAAAGGRMVFWPFGVGAAHDAERSDDAADALPGTAVAGHRPTPSSPGRGRSSSAAC